MKQQKAFTLAEVLITLGIIGVVAAMTIPTLIKNYEKRTTLTRLKEAYSTLSQVMLLAQAEYGDAQYWNSATGQHRQNNEEATTEFCEKYIIPYLSGAKVYGWQSLKQSGIEGYDALNGNAIANGNLNADSYNYTIELKNSQILFLAYDNDDDYIMTNIILYVDTNGQKKPNTFGKDLFVFEYKLKEGKFLPYLYTYSHERLKNSCTKDAEWDSIVCAALIMKDNWQINYW